MLLAVQFAKHHLTSPDQCLILTKKLKYFWKIMCSIEQTLLREEKRMPISCLDLPKPWAVEIESWRQVNF